MSKRIRIFLLAIAAVLVGATVLFLTINNSFVSPYLIHQQRNTLREVCDELSQDTPLMQSSIEYAEKNRGVVVAAVSNTEDINLLNERLREAFLNKGLGLSKYWLWQEDYNTTVKTGTQQRIYSQGNLGYSLLVQYIIKDTLFVAVATVIPHLSGPLNIASTASALIMGATALLLMALVWWMSSSLEKAQHKLTLKNEQMKQLLNNVSHDLKTPIALIKAYTAGMKDGLDDGSFLDTISAQNDRMELLTLRLLELSSCEDAQHPLYAVDISDLLSKELDQQMPLFATRSLSVERNIQQGLSLQSNPDTLTTIIENLLSNAVKYATASPIIVSLYANDTQILLEIKSFTDLPADTETDRLWEPFCVAECSRNSALSGSGLGLSLVRAAANTLGASYHCEISEGQFCVIVKMKASI